tara:strand:- start:14 stop:274 length:261 start_codon:yes stop_codon:yes gene_type:complete
MINELKNLFYILIIFIFIFFTGKYYFSDSYKKKSYRTINLVKKDINKENIDLKILKSDTDNVIEAIANKSEKKRKFKFWELLTNNQ